MTMRQRIIQIITDVGLNKNDFKVGSGAINNYSEIHYKPYQYNSYKPLKESYLIQYCGNIVAVWEVKQRVEKHASIDMKWNGVTWSEVQELRVGERHIKNSDESTWQAVMPIDCLDPFLRMTFHTDQEDFYINRVKEKGVEGEKVQIFTTRYERDSSLRNQAIAIHGTSCQACGFNFADQYGKIGEGYIEVHHRKPISEGKREVDPETDMVCLCPNCHRMIHHRRGYVMSIDELKKVIDQNRCCNQQDQYIGKAEHTI